MATERDCVEAVMGQVDDRPGTRQADDEEQAPWPDEVAQPTQRRPMAHVVDDGDGGDDIEALGWERRLQEVGDQVLDVVSDGSGASDARQIHIDAADSRDTVSETPCRLALAASDVESALRARRHPLQQCVERVEVRVPPLAGHGVTLRKRPTVESDRSWPAMIIGGPVRLSVMSKVLTHMCMSLDGFVAQPDDGPGELFDWYWGGDVVVPSAQEGMTFSVDAASAPMLRDLTGGCGAIIAGRRLFDLTDGWGDNHPAGAPVVVVTHRPPPDDAPERFPRTTFTRSVEEAVATAQEIAGDRFVTIASADIIGQALNLGLVDEICISQVPVLFGSGIRYFGELVGGHVLLDDPVVVEGTRALHLRYPVRR